MTKPENPAASRRHEHQVPHSRPRSGSRTATRRQDNRFCGGHGPGETPGPIPNPEAKPWHGDGTMPERTWESSTPPQPHFTEGPGNTRSPGLPRIPGTTQNPRHGHRRTGEHITPRDLHPMNTPPNRKNNNSLLFSPHLHASKPEEQPQSNTIFPIASSHCHLLTLSSWNAMLNNPSLCAACHRI